MGKQVKYQFIDDEPSPAPEKKVNYEFLDDEPVKKKELTESTETGGKGSSIASTPGSKPSGKNTPLKIELPDQNKSPEQVNYEYQEKKRRESNLMRLVTQGSQQELESNPIITAGKTFWNTLRHNVGPDLVQFGSLLTPDYPVMIAPGANIDTKEYHKERRAVKAEVAKWNNEQKALGAKFSEDVVNSMDKIEDPIDALNYVSSAVTQGASQIVPAVLSFGTSAIGQEVGSIYLESVNQIAKDKGIKPEEVITTGQDKPAIALAGGIAAGAIDYLSASKVFKAFKPNAFAGSLRKKGIEAFKSGVTEFMTEDVQTGIEQYSQEISRPGVTAGQAFEKVVTDPEYAKQRKEAAVQGFLGGSGTHAIGQIMSKSPAEVIAEQKSAIASTSDVKSAEKAADLIQQRINAPSGDLGAQPVEGLTNGSESGTRIPGQVGVGEKPIQAGTEQGGSNEAPAASGVVQTSQKEVAQTAQDLQIEPEEVQRQMRPFAEKMVSIERDFENAGLEISPDYDNQTIVTNKKTGEIVEPEDLPEHLKEKAGQYEQATSKLGEYSDADLNKTLQEVRNDTKDVKHEEVKPTELTREDNWAEKLNKELPKTVEPHEKIAQQYHEETRTLKSISPEDKAISEHIGKVTAESVRRFGDKNHITKQMAKAYLSKDGFTIDQVAQDAGVTPDQVWEFMQKYPSGPHTVSTPSGNPRLAELNDQYKKLTGKNLNQKTAKGIADKINSDIGTEQANNELQGLLDQNNEVDNEKVLLELERDPDAFKAKYGLTDEDLHYLGNELYGKKRQRDESQREAGGTDQQRPGQPSQGGPLSSEFGDQTQNPAQQAAEIAGKNLTHVPGLNMGKGLSEGTYVSTESQNRYGEGQPVSVSIEKPFVFKSENGIIPLRNKVLNDRFDEFGPEDFEGDPFSDKKTIEGLTEKGIDKLAGMVREEMQKEGFDSIYLPESETQEGELVVFDRDKVKISEKPQPQAPTRRTLSPDLIKAAVPRGKPVTVTDIDEDTGETVQITEDSQHAVARARRRVKALDLLISCVIS